MGTRCPYSRSTAPRVSLPRSQRPARSSRSTWGRTPAAPPAPAGLPGSAPPAPGRAGGPPCGRSPPVPPPAPLQGRERAAFSRPTRKQDRRSSPRPLGGPGENQPPAGQGADLIQGGHLPVEALLRALVQLQAVGGQQGAVVVGEQAGLRPHLGDGAVVRPQQEEHLHPVAGLPGGFPAVTRSRETGMVPTSYWRAPAGTDWRTPPAP